MTELSQAVVVLTGATGGFGQELTRQLLSMGSRLILTDLDPARLQEQATAILQDLSSTQESVLDKPAIGNVLACLAADLSTQTGSETLYRQVRDLGIPVDVLINNAGIGVYGRMDEVPADKWERLMQVNLLAPMRLSSLFGAEMIARRSGHIVNISSLAGWVATAGLAAYASSKFGLRGFSTALSREMRPYNVQVTAVYPFFSRTPILQSERFGSLTVEANPLPDALITDPAKVMAATIRGIQYNRLHVFPDRTAQVLHLMQRYSPALVNWLSR